ncbi:MAG: extracellular solute-binding protein [Lachnospiraceae bacterium]|nr:extracellular solute-binding protein [Lachnospiraceae bacterium]
MKHRKSIALLLAMVMILGLLAGCGGKGGDTTTEAPKAENTTEAPGTEAPGTEAPTEEETKDYSMYKVTEPTTIVFWHAVKGNDKYWDKVIAEFNALSAETNVTVEGVSIGKMNDCRDKLVAAHQAQQGVPVLTTINYPATPQFYKSGVITDISELMEANGFDFSVLLDGVVNQVKDGDAMFAMPWGSGATVYFTNETRLAEHNLAEFPETWDEFKTWTKAVYEATGKSATTILGTGGNLLGSILVNFGGTMMKEDDPTKTGFDNEHLVTRMKEMQELVSAGYVEWVDTQETMDLKFLNGDTMSVYNSLQYYRDYIGGQEAIPEEGRFDVGVAWTWGDVKRVATVAGNCLCVSETVSQMEKNAAGVFLAWLLNNKQYNEEWAQFVGNVVIYKDRVNDAEALLEMYKDLPGIATNIYPYLEEHYEMKPQSDLFETVHTEIQNAVTEIYLFEGDFDERWAQAIEEIEYILAGN